MANGDIAKASEAAVNLATVLAFLTHEHSKRTGLSIGFREFPKEWDDEAAKLEAALDDYAAGSKLSLANPYPVEVGEISAESYAHAVLYCSRRVLTSLRTSLEPIDFPTVSWDTPAHCLKEYERATGETLSADPDLDHLSGNVRRVIELLREGLSNEAVAGRTGESASNVATIKSRYGSLLS